MKFWLGLLFTHYDSIYVSNIIVLEICWSEINIILSYFIFKEEALSDHGNIQTSPSPETVLELVLAAEQPSSTKTARQAVKYKACFILKGSSSHK